MFPATLTTERLVLRPPAVDDAQAIYERYASDPEVTQHLTWAAHGSVDETVAWRESTLARVAKGKETYWAICVDGDPAPCGMITAWHQGHSQTLGYVLGRGWWGRGVMTEAVRLLTDALFADPSVWRVSAHAHVDNTASQRVLEKAGFRREGVLRRAFKIARTGDVPQDAALYARVRDDVVSPGSSLAPGH